MANVVTASKTFDDYLIKPMITTNLNAIYDDFVPYISDNNTLVEDIVNMKNNDNDINIEFLGYSIPYVMSVKNYVDAKGVFHQRVGRIDLSSLSYTYDSGNTQFYSGALSSLPQESKWNYNLYCNKYPTGSTSGDSYIASYGGRIYIRDKNYTDVSALVAALRNTYLYYKLVTENLIYPGAEQITQIDDSLSVIGKCKNLISTTLSNTTASGVTCTNNGDGTYTKWN